LRDIDHDNTTQCGTGILVVAEYGAIYVYRSGPKLFFQAKKGEKI
jgi:hypothetical protein